MVTLTTEQLISICPKLKKAQASSLLPNLLHACGDFNIDTPKRLAAFVSQCAHESLEFTHTEENMMYSAAGLMKTFEKYFTPQLAKQYERKPEKIANRVYANRYGNGPEASGDGWKYRGRGFTQITFKDTYRDAGEALGLDLVGNPELVAKPDIACRTAAWYWDSRGCNKLADEGDFLEITRRIVGGARGFQSRSQYWAKAKEVLGLTSAASADPGP